MSLFILTLSTTALYRRRPALTEIFVTLAVFRDTTKEHHFICDFAKLRKATDSFVMIVRPFVHMEQLGSHWRCFNEIWYLRNFRKFFENNLSFVIHLPMKMEPIVSSETSAIRIQTPGNYPKRNKLHLEHGESLKTR